METQCCIVGGGPAGMMLGLLLARAGVDVVVLEKHADFLRDFRGDTIHPSTLDVIAEIGLLDAFLARPHQRVEELHAHVGGREVTIADFRHLPTRCRFLAFMPQWDFLDLLAEHARRLSSFRLLLRAEVVDLLRDGEVVHGVRAVQQGGMVEIRAPLTVGADGRSSVVRQRAGLHVRDLGAPMDVLWVRIPRREGDPVTPFAHFGRGIVVLIYRGDYWQCGYVIPKGSLESLRARGLDALRAEIGAAVPFLADRLDALRGWDDAKLLTVKVDRLERWYRPGLLCIGDAAHAMSPIGGVGINLAIQDAVATANLLAAPLREGRLGTGHLAQVQQRRELPTRITQAVQVFAQDRVLRPSLDDEAPQRPSRRMQLVERIPALRRVAAWAVGMGVRPEHVRTT